MKTNKPKIQGKYFLKEIEKALLCLRRKYRADMTTTEKEIDDILSKVTFNAYLVKGVNQ